MRHQTAILVLILAVAAVANAELNCSSLAAPAQNFYNPTGACSNDTFVNICNSYYSSCVTAATTCAEGFICVRAKLRCFELIVPGADCTTWAAMLSNEKLYLAAGGDYNGSTLELSCQNVVCNFLRVKGLTCAAPTYANVCVDEITGSTPVPGSTPASTIPPAGAIVVTFTITGSKEKFDALLATESGRKLVYALVTKILLAILGITDASKIVIIDIRTGSLLINFYTTDPTLTLDSVRAKIEASKTADKTALFGELAAAAGIPLSEIGVGEFSVETATAAPGTTTPAPLTDSASLVATASAVLAALLALLL